MVIQASGNPPGFRKMILLLIIAGTVLCMISLVSAETGVTISAQGDKSYYLGEEVFLSGTNYDSDTTYLFITGPGINPDGGKLTSPFTNVTSGDTGSFDLVQTRPDKTWDYTLYTYNLGINPGPYSIYAVSQPKTAAGLTATENKSVRLIFKKPFITAEITPAVILKGQPITITGVAEGNPATVQLWIIGYNYGYTTTVPTSPDSSFTFIINPEMSETIPDGYYNIIVQHPMQNNQLDIIPEGEMVKNLQISDGSSTGGTNLFKLYGAGNLRGRDAAEALVNGFGDPVVDDTYTEIPLVIDESGIRAGIPDNGSFTGSPATQAQTPSTSSAPQQVPTSPLQYAPFGAFVLIGILFVLNRRRDL